MRKIMSIGLAALSLGGCSSFSADALQDVPPTFIDGVKDGALFLLRILGELLVNWWVGLF